MGSSDGRGDVTVIFPGYKPGQLQTLQGAGAVAGAAPGMPSSIANRALPWMPGAAAGTGSEAATLTARRMGKLAADPYAGIPKGILYGAQEGIENQYQQARAGTQSAALGSGAGRGGVARGILGNLEFGRGAALADATRSWDELRTKIGDERLASLLLPFLGEQFRMHELGADALIGQPKKQTSDQGGNFLSGILGAAMSAYGQRGGGRKPALAGGDKTSDYYNAVGGMA